MGTKIVVPVDGSDQSQKALEYTYEHFPDATVTLLHVINPARAGYGAQAGLPSFSEEWYEEAEAAAEELFEEAKADAPEEMTVETATEVGQPARTIVEFTEENGHDKIIIGSHGRKGISRVLLGSVAETVVRRAHVPVTVAR
ncbi:universal stress protein [Halosegnis rubeus]|jgi:nucleotide-binding universal stress UspA family protein|uniref:Universal stress protein n=1 Tax=Halosegnis rubeus TaxID=2212850 RepID=A0A5N5UE24_9EURY|nr:universal stress protein [Halosegnis rubeus]KAB7515910.1 universal stress protein [Halosegnis rubeus]KAB7516877.1 universal stress protein [Halosegnis rubeus]KAB7519996.1 universal stress protein [Halosegnis rubeus]